MAHSPHQRRFKLANQILDVIREGRFEQGHHLREQALGDLLQVSRTPIRSALQILAERGLIEARRNQGYFLIAGPDEIFRLELEVPSTTDQHLYDLIVHDRLAGRLAQTNIESDLARHYGVDRARLRRTLSKMLDDGLIQRKAGRGWSFPPMLDTKIGLQNSYAFRRITEPAGIMLPDFEPDAAVIERLRLQHLYLVGHPAIETVALAQLFETDAQFHETVAEFSGNPFLLQAVQQQNKLRRLLEFGGNLNRRRVRDWCREHLAILDAIDAGERMEAARLMQDHLNNALSAVPEFRTP